MRKVSLPLQHTALHTRTSAAIKGFLQTPKNPLCQQQLSHLETEQTLCTETIKLLQKVFPPSLTLKVFPPSLMLKHVKHQLITSNCAWFVQTKLPPHPWVLVIHSMYLRRTNKPTENKTAKDEITMNPNIIRLDSSALTSVHLQKSVLPWQPETCVCRPKAAELQKQSVPVKAGSDESSAMETFHNCSVCKTHVACLLCTLICCATAQRPPQRQRRIAMHKMVAKIHRD